VMFREAAFRDAVSPGLREEFLTMSRIKTVSCDTVSGAFWIFGLLRKPMLLCRHSGVRASLAWAEDGAWFQGRGSSFGVGWDGVD